LKTQANGLAARSCDQSTQKKTDGALALQYHRELAASCLL